MVDEIRLKAHLENGEREYIMCAAIHVDDGIDYMFQPYNIDKGLVYCGWRHPCILQQIPKEIKKKGPQEKTIVQGFLTNKNRFLNREESKEVCIKNNQSFNRITKEEFVGTLTSEDLW